MGYQIQYEPQKNKLYPVIKAKKPMFARLVLLMILLAAVFLGYKTDWLIPGDPEVTKDAFSDMVVMLQQGADVDQAVAAFCAEILDHGKNNSR